jgi:uroporphyrinogen-III synthase
VPTIETVPNRTALADFVGRLESFDWVVVTSAEAVRVLVSDAAERGVDLATAGVRWAAVGSATARALALAGVRSAFRPPEQTAAGLAGSIPIRDGDRVLLPVGDLARDDLASGLTARGAAVTRVTAYRTIVGPPASLPLLEAALPDRPAGAVVSSPSAVRGLFTLAETAGLADAGRALPLVAIGRTTASEIERLGLRLAAVSAAPDPASVADAVRFSLTPLETR